MAWHWAANSEALELFRPAAEAVRSQLGRKYELIGASFVIAEGGCQEGEARFHLDFGPPDIPSQAAVTALLPLYPPSFPEEEGNLEYRPWNDGKTVTVHRYCPGEAAVFHGKLPHRTQPFAAAAFEAAAPGSEASLRGLRVLASLSLAQVPPGAPWRPALEQVMSGYGAPLVPPLGSRQA